MAARVMAALKAPARPRSLVITTSSTRLTGRASSSGAPSRRPARHRAGSTSTVLSAWGRSSVMRCWARQTRAAATIFMARVIFWVFFTDAMRRRMTFSEGHSARSRSRLART